MKKKFSLFFLAITTMFFTFASPYIEYEVIREAELTQNPIPHYRVIKRVILKSCGLAKVV